MESLVAVLRRAVASRWKSILFAVISLSVFVLAWHAYSSYLDANDVGYEKYIPYPVDVAEAFFDSFVTPDPAMGLVMSEHIMSSLNRVFLGFCLSLLVALPLGLLMGSAKTAGYLGMPIVEVFRPIPPLAWIPIFLVVFGYLWGPVAIVFLGIFFPILLNVMFGVASVDPSLIDAAKTLGARRHHIFLKVMLPFTVPYTMTGIKVGLGIGWMCIVAAEMVGRYGGGVGYFIWSSNESGRYAYMFAGMVVIAILGILTTGVASQVEKRLYKWMGMR
jgi:ABC-type nitrate/sulfonate/bicarbonate transport system permease component